MSDRIPAAFFNMLPLSIMVGKVLKDDLNFPTVFLNQEFIRRFGYTLEDVPDKNSWWQLAYPEESYRKVVEKQWELQCELARENRQPFIQLELDVQTKTNGSKRFKIYTELESLLMPDHHVIAFAPVDDTPQIQK